MYKYLFYCTEIYCLSILRPLQKFILEKGGKAGWFFDKPSSGADYLGSNEYLLENIQAVKSYHPDAVFSPVNLVPHFFAGIKVQVFHGLANDFTGKKGHYKVRGLFDLYCTRAPEETRIFNDIRKKHEHFDVIETGWPKLDPIFSSADHSLRSRLGTAKPIVFFASTFSPSLTQAPALFEKIRELSKKDKYYWIITLHPKTDKEVMAKFRSLAGPNLSYFESHYDVIPLLQTGDVMLCDTSSIAIEFMVLDKPVVTFRTKTPGPYVIDVCEISDIENALDQALKRPDALMKEIRLLVNQLHPYRDGLSSQRVVEATNQLIAKGLGHLKEKPLNLYRKLKIRKNLGYYRFSDLL